MTACSSFGRRAGRSECSRFFELIDQGRVEVCLSADVLAEIRDVLTRPKLLAKYPALTEQAVDRFLGHYVGRARWIEDVPEHYVLARDPKDSKYFE
jgi:predicted nucleic acid-binding protein